MGAVGRLGVVVAPPCRGRQLPAPQNQRAALKSDAGDALCSSCGRREEEQTEQRGLYVGVQGKRSEQATGDINVAPPDPRLAGRKNYAAADI